MRVVGFWAGNRCGLTKNSCSCYSLHGANVKQCSHNGVPIMFCIYLFMKDGVEYIVSVGETVSILSSYLRREE
jgi:hypothetical protein